ncbi:monofunctional biosynthetic peptidoglycan transglycosylase [Maribius pontilimi]|uniref:Biosynthetic peptidoglycan transglycosylase n=1 Tax=Palleronia pontilimi TaxID=1964209 RepID=A0A934IK71_9RHOB|nr:monofunctional biosynthetic peptidoglycan transglycosylase [Palleronia pontilimi]MBJ3764075.1 monofunctional biosynthetic peptidoglycan transglycosylase [Palleronia pontilimi]
MAPKAKTKGKSRKAPQAASRWGRPRPIRWLARWTARGLLAAVAILLLAVACFAVFDPPSTPYMRAEARRLGQVDHEWVPLAQMAPIMARAAVAAEDANFCTHWGFDITAIRDAITDGGARGASTISQQVVKNVYLWQGRSWLRKALEAVITPVVEMVWSKRRILEVYLNVAEFGEGVFGVDAAAYRYFRVTPAELTATQATRLAAILPAPKDRSASNPSAFVQRRARAIRDGAATIDADGRADCFQ